LRGAWIFRSRTILVTQRRNGSSSTISRAMPQIAPAARSMRALSRVWVSASAVSFSYNLPRRSHAERPRHPGLDAEAIPCDWCLPCDRTHNLVPSGKFQRSMRRRWDHRGFCSARRSSSIHCAARRSHRSRSMGLFARSASVRHSSAALRHCSLSRFTIAR
jgi:hypothetical protein